MSIIRDETPLIFFRESFYRTAEKQGLGLSQESSAYVVVLLSSFVNGNTGKTRLVGEPLAQLFARAMRRDSRDPVGLWLLQSVGDISLFVSGFFYRSVDRHALSQYYATIGSIAYRRIAHPPFQELAAAFLRITQVLREMEARCRIANSGNILKLCDEWRDAQDKHLARILKEQGIDTNKTKH